MPIPAADPRRSESSENLSRARIVPSEFRYEKGTEIYGEAEPADYIYQIADGAVRSYRLLSDGRRQIGAFIWSATSSAWRTGGPPVYR